MYVCVLSFKSTLLHTQEAVAGNRNSSSSLQVYGGNIQVMSTHTLIHFNPFKGGEQGKESPIAALVFCKLKSFTFRSTSLTISHPRDPPL